MPKYHLDKSFIKEPIRFSDISLLQIGRLYFKPGDIMKPHTHKDFFELTIITDGEGAVSANGVTTSVKRGDIFLSLPYDMHRIISSEDAPMKYDFFSFWTTNEAYLSEFAEISRYLSPNDRVFTDERIHALVGDAIMEFVENAKFSGELLHAIFTQIIIRTIRDIAEGTKTHPRNATQAQSICYQLMNYIDTHVYSIKNLREALGELNYNYGYLSGLFKRTTGKTLREYFFDRKMETARALIIEKKKKVGEIAEMLGYNPYSFSKAFKEKYGVSPKNLQKEIGV